MAPRCDCLYLRGEGGALMAESIIFNKNSTATFLYCHFFLQISAINLQQIRDEIVNKLAAQLWDTLYALSCNIHLNCPNNTHRLDFTTANSHLLLTFLREVHATYTFTLRHVDPLLGNDSVNTFTRQRICRQQSDNFRYYATRCKYNNRGRGVFYVVSIYPLFGKGWFLWVRLQTT
jgi:hypothetical protein